MGNPVYHAFHCKKGVKHGNDDFRDNGAQTIKLIYPSVSCELVIRELESLPTQAFENS